LITHSILRIWPDGIWRVPWTQETIEISRIFFLRRGHCCRGHFFGPTTFCFFFFLVSY
jgi:hypothetical protein